MQEHSCQQKINHEIKANQVVTKTFFIIYILTFVFFFVLNITNLIADSIFNNFLIVYFKCFFMVLTTFLITYFYPKYKHIKFFNFFLYGIIYWLYAYGINQLHDLWALSFLLIGFSAIYLNIGFILYVTLITLLINFYNFSGKISTEQAISILDKADFLIQLIIIMVVGVVISITSYWGNIFLNKFIEEEYRANIDAKTGVYNRGYFDRKLTEKINEFNLLQKPFSLLIIDIDYFKKFNDVYGHLVGDFVLSLVGDILKQSTRKTDIVCRYGGEEFAIIIDGNITAAIILAEKIRTTIENHIFQADDLNEHRNVKSDEEKQMHITVSIGVAEYKNKETKEDLIKKTDIALYEAKNLGRNRVISAN